MPVIAYKSFQPSLAFNLPKSVVWSYPDQCTGKNFWLRCRFGCHFDSHGELITKIDKVLLLTIRVDQDDAQPDTATLSMRGHGLHFQCGFAVGDFVEIEFLEFVQKGARSIFTSTIERRVAVFPGRTLIDDERKAKRNGHMLHVRGTSTVSAMDSTPAPVQIERRGFCSA